MDWALNEPRHRAARAKYRATHRELVRARARRWKAENPEKKRVYERAYYAAHPDIAIERNLVRRARKVGAFVERVFRSVVWKRDKGICGICNQPADPTNWHLDHKVPLAQHGPHSYANTQVAHPTCNLRKGARAA